MWTPAEASNVPLSLSGTSSLRDLFDLCRLKIINTMFGSWVAAVSPNDGLNRLHLCTLLPILCASADAATCLSEDDVELLDILAFVRGQKYLSIATIELSTAALTATPDLHPALCVLLTTDTGSTFIYSGLSLEYVDGHRLVRFLVDPTRLAGAEINLVGATFTSRNLGCYRDHEVEVRPCTEPPAALATWLSSLAGSAAPPGQSITRFEEMECWKLSIDLNDEWWTRIEAGDSVETNARGDSARLQVLIKKTKQHPELKMLIDLPSPLSATDIRLLLSRKRRNVTVIVPKTAYDFASRSPAEIFLDDFDAWPMCRVDDSFMVTASGLQMSEDEKRVRSNHMHEPMLVPPLIALKDTLISIFQMQDIVAIHFCVSEDGTGKSLLTGNTNCEAIAINHGVRREVRYGTPAADLSICFLEPSFLDQVVPWWQATYPPAAIPPNGMEIYCTRREFELLKLFVGLLASRAKDRMTWKTPPNRHEVPLKFRRRFVRVLFPFLFAHEKILNRTISGARMSQVSPDLRQLPLAEKIKAVKDQGNVLVKAGRHSEAIGLYSQAINVFAIARDNEDINEDTKLQTAQCHLNMALCLLHSRTPANLTDAVKCCDEALELLKLPEQAPWRAKAHYRKGQALELSGDLSSAVDAIASAAATSPHDEAIRQALSKLKDQQGRQ